MTFTATELSLAIAARLESLVRRADTFGPKSRADILEELGDIAQDLRRRVDREEKEMALYFGQEV